MPRARDPNRDKAFKIWKASGGEIDLVEIAAQLDVSPGTVRGWKSKDKWNVNGTLQSNKRNAPKAKERSKSKTERIKPVVLKEIAGDGFTDKQRLFIAYYLKYWNATKAYQKAYGADYETARTEGCKNLAKPRIRAEIQKARDEVFADSLLSAQAIVQKYMDIAFADMGDFVSFGSRDVSELDEEGEPVLNEDGTPKTYRVSYVEFMSSEQVDGTIISEVKKGKDGVSIKLADRMKALERLDKYFGLMTEEQRVKVAKAKLELKAMEQEPDADPHEQGSGYEEALNAQAAEVFAAEVNSNEED